MRLAVMFVACGSPPPPTSVIVNLPSPPSSDVHDAGVPEVEAPSPYEATLAQLFREQGPLPSARGCVIYRVSIAPRMIIWHFFEPPIRTSGSDEVDAWARTVLQKLLDNQTPLPAPPPDKDGVFRGRNVDLRMCP